MKTLLAILMAWAAIAPYPATAAIAPDATVDQVLDALQASGQRLSSLSCDLNMDSVDQTTGNDESQDGTLLLQRLAENDWRVRINFTQLTQGDKLISEHHEWSLANGWLNERDYQKKIEFQRQVVKPGEKIDPLKLGEGPFPLPIGQKKEAVHNQFEVSLAALAKDDPPNAVHLLLKPKTGNDLSRRFAQIDVWVNRDAAMPIKIVTLDQTRQTLRTTTLKNLKVDSKLQDSDFALPPVSGWNVTVEPLKG